MMQILDNHTVWEKVSWNNVIIHVYIDFIYAYYGDENMVQAGHVWYDPIIYKL